MQPLSGWHRHADDRACGEPLLQWLSCTGSASSVSIFGHDGCGHKTGLRVALRACYSTDIQPQASFAPWLIGVRRGHEVMSNMQPQLVRGHHEPRGCEHCISGYLLPERTD